MLPIDVFFQVSDEFIFGLESVRNGFLSLPPLLSNSVEDYPSTPLSTLSTALNFLNDPSATGNTFSFFLKTNSNLVLFEPGYAEK